LEFLEDYFDIQPKEGVEDPVYPTDYTFKQKIDIKDGSNQYLLSEITNNVNTIEQYQTDDIIFDIDKSDNTLSCVMSLPGARREDTNPKLYSNIVGSVFPDSLLKVGVANISRNGSFSPEDFGDYWFIRKINVNVPTPTSSQKTLTLTQNTNNYETIYPPTGQYWNSIRYKVDVKFNIKYFNINNGTLQNIINSLSKNNSSSNRSFDIPNNYFCLVINKNNNENEWDFECSVNGTGVTTNGTVKGYGRWGVFGAPAASLDIRIFDENSQFIAKFNEDTNTNIGLLGLSLNHFNIQNF